MTIAPPSASDHPETGKFDYPMFHAETLPDLHTWLAVHHTDTRGMWFVSWDRDTGKPRLDWTNLVRELLCWGWIDSTAGRLDEHRRIQLCTPRKARSTWSRLNRQHVDELDAAGRMQPSGWAAVEAAKANGWWTILEPVEDLIEPDELRVALDADPEARATWDGFPASPRKQMLWWVYSAVKPDTRARRVAKIVAAAHAGQRALG